MTNVGVLLSVEIELRGTQAEAKRRILTKFQTDPDRPVPLFKMIPFNDGDLITETENVVVAIPGSKLTCESIDQMIENNQIQDQTISKLQAEVTNLKRRLAQSDSVRQEALDTVNQLRSEFMHLIEELTPRTSQVASTTKISSENSSKPHGPCASRSIPKLRLSNIRN